MRNSLNIKDKIDQVLLAEDFCPTRRGVTWRYTKWFTDFTKFRIDVPKKAHYLMRFTVVHYNNPILSKDFTNLQEFIIFYTHLNTRMKVLQKKHSLRLEEDLRRTIVTLVDQ